MELPAELEDRAAVRTVTSSLLNASSNNSMDIAHRLQVGLDKLLLRFTSVELFIVIVMFTSIRAPVQFHQRRPGFQLSNVVEYGKPCCML